MRVLMTGASGLIGTALSQSLEDDGAEVVRLVRRSPQDEGEIRWDPAADSLDQAAVEGFDAVIHLAGAGIGDSRWSEHRKRVILDSRVDGTTLLAERIASAERKPSVLLSASAIGYYGDREQPVTEADGPASPADFLSEVCVAWEGATTAAETAGIRTVHLRTGLVLSKGGGAIGKMLLPFRLGLGGQLASGETWWSWISLDDHIRAVRHLIDQPVHGPVNLTSPKPAMSREVTKALGKVLRRPTFMPIPRFGLEILLGKELANALLFTSARVMPAKLEESGFSFEHPDIENALQAVLDQ
jgi:uncharacterized protein (TIGR01777 family)